MSAVLVSGVGPPGSVREARAQSTAAPVGDTAAAGALASLPARGLAAAIAEAGRIEVPAVDPTEAITISAAQASRWTEGSYDVWHLTGGVKIVQGAVEAGAHEAVVWIEQDSGQLAPVNDGDEENSQGPAPRSLLVRMAGNVQVRAGGTEPGATASTVRGERWSGRFWTIRDPRLDFPSVVPATGMPPIYDAPAEGA